MIYVDDMIYSDYHGKRNCHLIGIPPDDPKLHEIARKIGLKFSWFQPSPPASWPHYDLFGGKRKKAIAAGAMAIKSKDLALMRIKYREEVSH